MRFQIAPVIQISCVLLLTALCLVSEAAERPNVVLVMTDDQGYGDLSCHGNPILKTPALDALHADAVRLTDYHVSPTCSPTRAALLTGHWTNRTGVWHTIMGRSMLRENEVTLGQIFKDSGYVTGMFGKWHLGDNYPCRPEDRGFMEVMRHGGGGVGQTPDFWDNAYFDGSYFHNSKPEAVQGFCTDVWFDYAKRFIRQQKKDDQPFLAYIVTNAPHGPMHSPEESSKPYAKLGVNVANFFGMIQNIDNNVGQLRKFLDDEGLTENTIFVFTTDNGTSSGDRVFNAGMRGKKGSEFDGGHRVPFFIHWPAGGLTGGRDVKPITAHVDIVPTLIDLCGIASPEDIRFDGRSLRPLLGGKSSKRAESDVVGFEWPDRILVTDSQRVKDPIKWRKSAVMTSQWRLVNGEQLFDMNVDPGQKTNVSAAHSDVLKRLRGFYEDWWTELTPTFAQDVAIALGHKAQNPTTLTSHDWITTGSTPWNQSHIRMAQTGPAVTGFWNVNVTKAGKYVVRLRRWPREADAAIDAALPPGANVPGVNPYRARPGKPVPAVKASLTIGDKTWEADAKPASKEVEFGVDLEAGRTRLSALFHTADGKKFGVYYAYIGLVE